MRKERMDLRANHIPSNKVELLFVKSKVFLHPTKAKKDNVSGFLTLSRGSDFSNRDILMSFTPESQLPKDVLRLYEDADLASLEIVRSIKNRRGDKKRKPYVVPKPSSGTFGFSFSMPLSMIYSIQFRRPSIGWWYGSIITYLASGEKLPIVFFHDDESSSTLKNQKARNQLFNPFDEGGDIYWGGKDFLEALSCFADVPNSTLEPTIYLVNPESNDLRNFAPLPKSRNKDDSASNKASQASPFNDFITNAKWKVLETVASLTAKTRNHVTDVVNEHAPPQVKQLLQKPEIQRIGNDYESARVYLAKWAVQVKEEAEEAQQKYMLSDDIYRKINYEIGDDPDILTDEEINTVSRRNPISKVEWDGFFDSSGRLLITVLEVKDRIFHGGLEEDVRKDAWPFLLEIFPWDSSAEDRKVLMESYETSYFRFKQKWMEDESTRNSEYWIDQKHRIEKDVHRTDRNLAIFSSKNISQGSEELNSKTSESIQQHSEFNDDDDDKFDISNITNVHLFRLREILLTYNEYNTSLGYVQGMNDLLSPLYVVFEDEVTTFWTFVNFMNRMEPNFVGDLRGIKSQMLTLNQLVQFMLPNLFKHLRECDSTDLFFFFRMLLVWFKREFEWHDVLRLWEVFWTNFYSSSYHLFFATAILSDNERIIRQNLKGFDEVLKYINDLSLTMNRENLLIRSELLFLRFRKMVSIIDREKVSLVGLNLSDNEGSDRVTNTNGDNSHVLQISQELRLLLSRK